MIGRTRCAQGEAPKVLGEVDQSRKKSKPCDNVEQYGTALYEEAAYCYENGQYQRNREQYHLEKYPHAADLLVYFACPYKLSIARTAE